MEDLCYYTDFAFCLIIRQRSRSSPTSVVPDPNHSRLFNYQEALLSTRYPLFQAGSLQKKSRGAVALCVRGSTAKVLVNASSATSAINWRSPEGPSRGCCLDDLHCGFWATQHPVAPRRPLSAKSWHDQDFCRRAP